jgi:hypothetical protein
MLGSRRRSGVARFTSPYGSWRLAVRAIAVGWPVRTVDLRHRTDQLRTEEEGVGGSLLEGHTGPSRKSLEEFDFDHQRSLKRDAITHLGTLDFIAGKENVVSSGRRGPVRRACRSGWASGRVRPGTGRVRDGRGAGGLRSSAYRGSAWWHRLQRGCQGSADASRTGR